MSDCIDTVTSLMPSSSGFDESDVQEILDKTVGVYFDKVEERIEEVLNAHFLTEATGEYLDLLHGQLYGLEREHGESDEDYRNRLLFQTKNGIRLNDLLDLGCKVYLCPNNFSTDLTWTTRKVQNYPEKLAVDCPNENVKKLIKDNIIWENIMVFI